jgi:hypothetical protein
LLLTEDGVDGVHGDLVLGGVADEPLGVREGHIGRRGAVALVVGDDLDAVMLPHADARVGRAEVDADSRPVALPSHGDLVEKKKRDEQKIYSDPSSRVCWVRARARRGTEEIDGREVGGDPGWTYRLCGGGDGFWNLPTPLNRGTRSPRL